MATSVTSSGLTFPDSTTQTTAAAGEFDSGVVMVFYQASAPSGWTQSTTNNDKALRVVSGTGGGTGGTHGLSSPPSTSHTHTGGAHTHSTPNHSHNHNLSAGNTTLSTNQIPSHTHSLPNRETGYSFTNRQAIRTQRANTGNATSGSTGGGGSHGHSMSGSIATSGGSNTGSAGANTTSSAGPTAFAPTYVDVIICSKD